MGDMKSLNLNWIRKKSDKTILMPEVVYQDIVYDGLYLSPETSEVQDYTGKYVYSKYGFIVLSINCEREDEIIAHEWRHHWQFMNGWIYDGIGFDVSDETTSYETKIKNYFKQSQSEMDALFFQTKFVGVDEYWKELLYSDLKEIL